MKSYSVVMATYNKAWALPYVLQSILPQMTAQGEIVVVDDGSTDNTAEICSKYPVQYVKLTDAVGTHRNPSVARNAGYKAARGEVVIAQSDEVIHVGETIKPLVYDLKPGEYQCAAVWDLHIRSFDLSTGGGTTPKILETARNYMKRNGGDPARIGTKLTLSSNIEGTIGRQRAGYEAIAAYFYLGSLWRKDIYAVGGNDEDFKTVAGEDDWFDRCLRHKLRLKPVRRTDITGYHLMHADWPDRVNLRGPAAMRLLRSKIASGVFEASGGPWEYS